LPLDDEKQRVEPGGWKRAVDLFNKVAKPARKRHPVRLHNHSSNSIPPHRSRQTPLRFFLAELDPKFVAWNSISAGSASPEGSPRYFEKYPGRFPLVHVKDWIKDASTPILTRGRWASPSNSAAAWPTSARAPWIGRASRAVRQSRHPTLFRRERRTKSAFDDIKISYNYLQTLRSTVGQAFCLSAFSGGIITMRKPLTLTALFAITALFFIAAARPQSPAWKPLFNGKDLTGWSTSAIEQHAVEDGRDPHPSAARAQDRASSREIFAVEQRLPCGRLRPRGGDKEKSCNGKQSGERKRLSHRDDSSGNADRQECLSHC